MNLFSSKEGLIVALGFLLVLSLPFVAILILTNVGINLVSDRLATSTSKTGTVQILDPITGKAVKGITSHIIWPVKGVVTLEFGESDLPYQPFHTGIDIANPYGQIGDPVKAFMSGTV